MPSKHQQGTDSKWQSEYDRQVQQWPAEWLLNLKPMVEEAAIGYWNASHRADAPADVTQHFRECMQDIKEK